MAVAEYYLAKYPHMTREEADRVSKLDDAMESAPEPQLCRIDDPSCESCQ